MNAMLQLTARLYAPLSTAQYFANAQLRLNEQCLNCRRVLNNLLNRTGVDLLVFWGYNRGILRNNTQ